MREQKLMDGTAPVLLKKTQEWFAGIITTPLKADDTIERRTSKGASIAKEAALYIVPSPTLLPHQRMQIYNQQYWWRLLNHLQENFPMGARLLGKRAFNQKIGVPYFAKFPPNHWSLTLIGERLPGWIAGSYRGGNRNLLLNMARLDAAFMASSIAPQLPLPNLAGIIEENPDDLLVKTFCLQPHIHLFTLEYDLFTFRGSLLKEGIDYWTEHPLPDLPKGKMQFFILFRNSSNNLSWREISEAELLLLEFFKQGANLNQAADWIESQKAAISDLIAEHLQQWLQEWVQAGWLTFDS